LALTIGILFGIYSSVLVACPIALYLGISRENLITGAEKKENVDEMP
jgi:preprotein translocase subunit SecF